MLCFKRVTRAANLYLMLVLAITCPNNLSIPWEILTLRISLILFSYSIPYTTNTPTSYSTVHACLLQHKLLLYPFSLIFFIVLYWFLNKAKLLECCSILGLIILRFNWATYLFAYFGTIRCDVFLFIPTVRID